LFSARIVRLVAGKVGYAVSCCGLTAAGQERSTPPGRLDLPGGVFVRL